MGLGSVRSPRSSYQGSDPKRLEGVVNQIWCMKCRFSPRQELTGKVYYDGSVDLVF